MKSMLGALAVLMMAWAFSWDVVLADDTDAQIQTLLNVEKGGLGQAKAVQALRELMQQPATTLIPILQGIDKANPLAANWLRGAFETIADRDFKAGNPLPKDELEKFAVDRSHAAQSRQLAFDWLVRIDPSATNRLVPGMLDDPSTEFRRAGVQRLIDQAAKADEAKDAAKSKELYQKAFGAALDPDQLNLIFDQLTKLGEKPDLKSQLGLVTDWWLIAPFDHRKGIGFETAYPPEEEIDLQKKYVGKEAEVSWVKKVSDQRDGLVNLNKLLAPHKGAVAYAYCEFESDRAQPVEIRMGTPNGWKLWINGEPVFSHEEYHQLMQMDQYRTPVVFQAGTNKILLKICQNEQTQDWAQVWEFIVRVCDSSGKAVLPTRANQAEVNKAARN